MIDELELLRRHLSAGVDADPDLEPVRQRLVAAMEADGDANRSGRRASHRTHRYTRRRTALGFGGLVGAAIVAVVVALVVAAPSTRNGPPQTTTQSIPSRLSVGDQLRLVADRAAEQPIPRLQADQALFTQADLSVVADVNNAAAQATIRLAVQKWSTAAGQTCTSLTAQPAQFDSPSDEAAWVGLNLLVTPKPQTASQCLQGGGAMPPDAITGAGRLIDVSSLPDDPATLAQELESGTTAIPALDQLLPDEAAPNPGFQRAAMLLVGPVLGATPSFESALYQAIALLPGVTALGPSTTHDGQTGQGFASGPGSGQSTIVVDPSTGRLLEVSGLDDSDSLTGIAVDYLNGGPMLVTAYSAQLQWLDPVGSPSVIGVSQLPPGLPAYVVASTRPGLTYDDALTLAHDVARPYARLFTSSQSQLSDSSNPASPGVFEWSFTGPGPEVEQFMQALRASGLFSSVSEI
jgi:hypothetical protein